MFDPEAMPPDESAVLLSTAWDESKHHRGQPGNKGEFGPGGAGGGKAAAPAAAEKPTAAPEKPTAAKAPAAAPEAGKPKSAVASETKTAPPPGPEYKPDVEADKNGDGVTDAARIGVPAMSVPPPPKIGLLPNLTARERHVERTFAALYEQQPELVAGQFLNLVKSMAKPGAPPTFGTDDAKMLTDEWMDKDQTTRASNRATLNCALHQTANAVAKKAFLMHLDTLKKGDSVMVTVGGCGAGKGFSLGKVPEAMSMKNASKAVWDSAGDQCATENPWIQAECEKRGLKAVYAFVHADPRVQWAHPERGVVKRAGDPTDGRMVDAKVFADSYALGAKNHQAFYEKNKSNPNAQFVFLSNGAKIPGIPPEALNIDRKELAAYAEDVIAKGDAPPHVKRGGLIGERIWP